MSNVNTAPTPAADQEIDQRLAVVQEAVSVLANPIPVLEDIEAELDILNDEEADPEALNAIHNNAVTLLDSQQRLATAFMTTLEALAKALKDQREAARKALDELKNAIDDVDLNVPEVERLATMIKEMQSEDQMWYFDDMAWEHVEEGIVESSPLDYTEASGLLSMLTDGEIEHDHYLWDELRDWMRRTRDYINTGITPPPAASNE